MDDIAIDPKLNYLIVRVTPSVDDLAGAEVSPAAIVPLTKEFFEWMEARQSVVKMAYELHLAVAVFHRIIDFADLDVFNPESYSPDGDEDVEDTKKLKFMLAPLWEKLEDDHHVVVSGKVLQDCGLDPFERLDDFVTINEYYGLMMTPVFDKEPQHVFDLEIELKHTYDPWNSAHIDFEGLKKHKSVEQG